MLKAFLRVPLENVRDRIFDLDVLGKKASLLSLVSNLSEYVSLDINLALASRGWTDLHAQSLPGRAILKDFVGTEEPVNFDERTNKLMWRDKPDILVKGVMKSDECFRL